MAELQPSQKVRFDEIERLCKERQLSLYALSKQSKVHVKTLKRWSTGEAGRIGTIEQIAAALGVGYETLLDGYVPSPAPDTGDELAWISITIKVDVPAHLFFQGNRLDPLRQFLTDAAALQDGMRKPKAIKGSVLVKCEVTKRDLFRIVRAWLDGKLDGQNIVRIDSPLIALTYDPTNDSFLLETHDLTDMELKAHLVLEASGQEDVGWTDHLGASVKAEVEREVERMKQEKKRHGKASTFADAFRLRPRKLTIKRKGPNTWLFQRS
jgi:hypothetical protein